jgi:hypothetical protein
VIGRIENYWRSQQEEIKSMKSSNINNRSSVYHPRVWCWYIFIALLLGYLGLVPLAPAVSPPPDGGYPGGNTAEGQNAFFSLTTGGYNTAVGFCSLRSDIEGSFNTAIGAGALFANTAINNTATGAGALLSNTLGINNTATGAFALSSNLNGEGNTADGYRALANNHSGHANTAVGNYALSSNAGGNGNTAVGDGALGNSNSNDNTAVGVNTLGFLTSGEGNIAIGFSAGTGVTTASHVIAIGIAGADVSDTTWVNHIYAVTPAGGSTLPVIVSSQGQLGTAPSAARFKEEIKPMESASQSILALKPVTFRYKNDNTNTPQFGLVAEEVAEVNPDLVARDKNGEIYSVRYDAVNAMLLNEFLKEHRKVEELQAARIAERKEIAELKQQLNAQAATIQKVSAQVELTRPAPRTVANDQ